MTLADKGARVGNFLVDSILFLFLLLIQFAFAGWLTPYFTDDIEAFFTAWTFLFYCCYYFFFEYFLGRTPGKYLTKTMVVNRYGQKPGAKAVLLRTISRLTLHDNFSFIFGQGLHDGIAGTRVIYQPKKTTLLKGQKTPA